MPTDELKERIQQMRAACKQAASWNSTEATEFRKSCTPASVLALISELERLQEENDELRERLCRYNPVND